MIYRKETLSVWRSILVISRPCIFFGDHRAPEFCQGYVNGTWRRYNMEIFGPQNRTDTLKHTWIHFSRVVFVHPVQRLDRQTRGQHLRWTEVLISGPHLDKIKDSLYLFMVTKTKRHTKMPDHGGMVSTNQIPNPRARPRKPVVGYLLWLQSMPHITMTS